MSHPMDIVTHTTRFSFLSNLDIACCFLFSFLLIITIINYFLFSLPNILMKKAFVKARDLYNLLV